MHFKNLFISLVLFFFAEFFAQQNSHPCLNTEKMQSTLYQIAQYFEQEDDMTIYHDEDLKKRIMFMQKFSKLSHAEQKKKIEKWFSCELRQNKILGFFTTLIDILENKKFDEKSLDALDRLINQMKQSGQKENFLCLACEKLLLDEKELNELHIKMFFHQLKKEESQKFLERANALNDHEKKACNEFDDFEDFLKSYTNRPRN